MTSGRLWVSAILLMVAITACTGASDDGAWRQSQEPLIEEAVVEDLMELPPDSHAPSEVRTIVCVFSGWDQSGFHDPSPALLARLEARHPAVYPASGCEATRPLGTVTHKASGEKAQLLGVHSLEWRRDDFVTIEGERIVGPAAGASWIYTLSHTEKGWAIDTAKADKIY